MKELLEDLLEYMESRADADIEGRNKEMGFQIRIEEALAKMENLSNDFKLKERLLKAKDEIHGYTYSMPFNLSEDDIETILDALNTAEMFSKIKIDAAEPQPSDLPAENTVMWWLCRIADDEVRRKAVGNVFKHPRKHGSLRLAIGDGFEWEDTNEAQLWNRLFYASLPLLPTPEWKEYLELKSKP